MNKEQFQSLIGTKHLVTNKCWFEVDVINVQYGFQMDIALTINELIHTSVCLEAGMKTFPEHNINTMRWVFDFYPNKNLSCEELIDDMILIIAKFLTTKDSECYCPSFLTLGCSICQIIRMEKGRGKIHTASRESIQKRRDEYFSEEWKKSKFGHLPPPHARIQ
jgi:hypothetical protein